ncbi:MAG TPA: hypothetical protein VF147_01485 [Vicinamibacterales bacterium]
MSSTPAWRAALIRCAIAVTIGAATSVACGGNRAGYEVMALAPAAAARIAFVRAVPCGDGLCQAIWIGGSRDDAREVATLGKNERCEEIAWAADGYRVGFVINGYQLRIYDGMTGEKVGQVNLLEPDGTPTTRIARGVTFSQNGAAVTFDDCPRHSSGCKSSMAAVR